MLLLPSLSRNKHGILHGFGQMLSSTLLFKVSPFICLSFVGRVII